MKQNGMKQATERATKLEVTVINTANTVAITIIANAAALLVWLAC